MRHTCTYTIEENLTKNVWHKHMNANEVWSQFKLFIVMKFVICQKSMIKDINVWCNLVHVWVVMGLREVHHRIRPSVTFKWIFNYCDFCFLLNTQAVSLSLPPAIFCLFLSLMREWWWHMLGDGDRVPNQASYEAVSPLLIICPHCCLASFVFSSTHRHICNSGEPRWGWPFITSPPGFYHYM